MNIQTVSDGMKPITLLRSKSSRRGRIQLMSCWNFLSHQTDERSEFRRTDDRLHLRSKFKQDYYGASCPLIALEFDPRQHRQQLGSTSWQTVDSAPLRLLTSRVRTQRLNWPNPLVWRLSLREPSYKTGRFYKLFILTLEDKEKALINLRLAHLWSSFVRWKKTWLNFLGRPSA